VLRYDGKYDEETQKKKGKITRWEYVSLEERGRRVRGR